MLIPAEPANLADAIGVQEPRDLLGRCALAGDADGRGADPIGGNRRRDAVSRGDRRLAAHGRRRRRTVDEQSVCRQQVERLANRLGRRCADLRDDLLEGARPVEQRKQRGKQGAHCAAFEDDDRPAVLEQQPVAVLDEAVPRREPGQKRHRRAQSDPRPPQLQLLQQHTASIANAPAVRPWTVTVRSRSSLVSSSIICTSVVDLSNIPRDV